MSFILENHPAMELVPIDKEQFKGLSDGFGYPQTARLFPHRIQGKDISWHCSTRKRMKMVLAVVQLF